MTAYTFAALLIGGALLGAAVAWWLERRPAPRVGMTDAEMRAYWMGIDERRGSK